MDHRASPGACSHNKGDVEHAVGTAWRVITSKSITSGPKSKEGARRETISNCDIAMVTIRKQPGRLVAQVRMTRATLLRSRMNGHVPVRLCSRVGVATSRLRQRPQVESDSRGRGCETCYPEAVQRAHGRAVEHGKGSAGSVGGWGKRSVSYLARSLPNLLRRSRFRQRLTPGGRGAADKAAHLMR